MRAWIPGSVLPSPQLLLTGYHMWVMILTHLRICCVSWTMMCGFIAQYLALAAEILSTMGTDRC